MGPLAMLANPALGIGMTVAGLATKLGLGPSRAAAEKAEGEKMFGAAKSAYQTKLDENPNYYSTASVDNAFSKAREDMLKSNSQNTNELLNRYSSVQRRQLQNRIRSGLTAGAAQASALQNQIGFQQQANKAFQQQAQNLSNLDIRSAQARNAEYDKIQGRKGIAAREALQAQGIINPAALGGLASKMKGY